MGCLGSSFCSSLLLLLLISTAVITTNGGHTSSFVRKLQRSLGMPLDSDAFRPPPGYNAPQQVHITQGDLDGKAMIVSWVTVDEPGSSQVVYWKESRGKKKIGVGKYNTYKYSNYTSGYIHHCTVRNLEYDTKYYYEVGIGHTVRRFHFTTPPPVGPDVPYTFGIIGDLGQSFDSNVTLTHYENNPKNPQMLLFLGDLSYADQYPKNEQAIRWDTWGRFVERSVAYQPWVWIAGNHEIEFVPEIGENEPFKQYTNRYHVPFEASGSTSPLWYSIKRGSAYIIVLSSYSGYGKGSLQWFWLRAELPKVNRTETPWLIVMVHAPWYNSYNYHYMEGESMRVVYESMLVDAKVDLVLAGHVHAYERSERISNVAYNIVNGRCTPVKNQDAPVYITVGDGGNTEGLANNMTYPQPEYSAFREASFGHAILDVKNRTHARYSWHRNQDGYSAEADSMWFYNRFWHPVDDSSTRSQS